MNEYEDALDAIDCPYLDTTDIEPYINAVRRALEKQIPKKPLIDPKWIFSLQCPCCRAEIADTEHRWEKRREHLKATMFFCTYCGQALDWSDAE